MRVYLLDFSLARDAEQVSEERPFFGADSAKVCTASAGLQ